MINMINNNENKGKKLQVILASASPRRKELLMQIGIDYRAVPGTAEEYTTKTEPAEVVQELSYRKAEEVLAGLVRQGEEDCLVIGADTGVSHRGRVMGKPGSEEEACQMLSCLQGSIHQVYTGVTLLVREKGQQSVCHTFYEKTDVSMYPMTEEEIRAYAATGESMDKAGAYAIQGRCAVYIRGICGDYNNVVGLPVGRLYQELKSLGVLECI